MTATSRMPAAFLGHGSPMNALDDNRYTQAWRAFGSAVPRPAAILMVSAHWYINASAVTSMAQPRTIHDFYGFPPELFAIRYPAPGDSDLASDITELLKPTWVGQDQDSWGIDHGSWSVLVHAFPAADIPVIQLSINAMKPFDYHVDLGRRLAPLRDRGVLILGSGNVVHNLRMIDWTQPDAGFDWAQRFDDRVAETITSNPGDLGLMVNDRDYQLAAPTPDHFIPLLYLAGLAEASGDKAEVIVDGYSMGSLSMASYAIGCGELPDEDTSSAPAPLLPDVPADETNL